MKKISLIGLVVFLLYAGNAFGVSFRWIYVASVNRESGWNLDTSLELNSPNAPVVEYSWDGDNFHPMAYDTMWGIEYYTANVTEQSGISPPTNFNGKSFTYRVMDGPDTIQVSGTVHTIRQIALSADVTILNGGIHPTISWFNPDSAIDSYRIQILDEFDDRLWETSLPYTPHVEHTICDFSFIPEKQYYIRIQANYSNALSDIQGDPVSLFFTNLNRSIVILPYNTTDYPTATSLTWSLENVTFNDGGIATGTFTFESACNSVLDWNISVSGGDEVVFPAFTYTPTTAPDSEVFIVDPGLSLQFCIDSDAPGGTPESRALVLTTEGPLTDSGGTVPLEITDPLWESRECYNCNPWREVVTGSVNAVPACLADLNGDGDVDGSDLVDYMTDTQELPLDIFAKDFGRINCP